MKEPKVVRIFRTFHSNDWKQFETYLDTIRKGEDIIDWRLFQYLKRHLPEPVEKSMVWKAVMDDAPFSRPKLTKYFHNLRERVETYWKRLGKYHKRWEEELEIIRQYNRRGLGKEAQSGIEKLREQILTASSLDVEDLYALYELAGEEHYCVFRLSKTHFESGLPLMVAQFDQYWVHQKLKLACLSISANQLHKLDIPILGMEAVIQTYEGMSLPENSLIPIYRELYELLMGNRRTLPSIFREMLQACLPSLDSSTYREIFSLILNHYAKEKNQGGELYVENIRILIEIYQWGQEAKLLYVGPHLIPKSLPKFHQPLASGGRF